MSLISNFQTDEREEPIQPHPQNSKVVVWSFDLYASGRHTFETLADQLAGEGYTSVASRLLFRPQKG